MLERSVQSGRDHFAADSALQDFEQLVGWCHRIGMAFRTDFHLSVCKCLLLPAGLHVPLALPPTLKLRKGNSPVNGAVWSPSYLLDSAADAFCVLR